VGQTAKYHLYPCASALQRTELAEESSSIGPFDFNYFREVLKKNLSEAPACFKWAVQFYENEETTPVNDSTIEWKTPFYDVAEVHIPVQSWGTVAQEAFCAMMSFNPASTIVDHELIGPFQMIRKAVYTTLGQLRRKLSNQSLNDVTYQDWLNYPNM